MRDQFSLYSKKVLEHFQHPRNVGEIKNPDGIGHIGNPICITGNTLICANSKMMPICNVKPGTKVLSEDGRFHKVVQTHKRFYTGKIYSFRIQSLGEIMITPEHHILALKMSHLDRRYSQYKRFDPDWYCAEELEKGDVILYSVPQESTNTWSIVFDIPTLEWDFKSKKLPKKIELSNDFLKLVGYYLAEGYVRTDKCKGTVGFVFGGSERKYVNEVIKIMKTAFYLDPAPLQESHNSINVMFYSARLARFFEDYFGKGAISKHLPQFMTILPPERQRYIITGVWRGDGYVSNKGAKYCTISKQLAYQLKFLLMRQQIVFSFLTIPAQGIHKENYHLYVRSIPSLKKLSDIVGIKFSWPSKKKKSLKGWYDEKFFYTPISFIKKEHYSGNVFNLEVEAPRSYVSDSVCLHNCGDIMELYIKVKDNKIVDAKFKTFGCGAAIATSSMVTEMVKGKTIEEALKISNRAVAEALDGLPPIKMHCSALAEDALKAAIKDYLAKKDRKDGH